MTTCHCEAKNEFAELRLLLVSLEEENAILKKSLEASSKNENSQVAALKQECHSMQLRWERQESALLSCQEDLEALQREKAVSEGKMKEGQRKVVEECQERVSELQKKLEQSRNEVVELQGCKGRVAELLRQLQQLKQQQPQSVANRSFEDKQAASVDEELLSLREEKVRLLEEKEQWSQKNAAMEKKLREEEGKVVEMTKQLKVTNAKCDGLVAEKQDLKGQIKVSQAQLAASKARPDHPQGNSLFSEVEDRRVEVEKAMVVLREENEALRRKLKVTQELLKEAKTQGLQAWERRAAEEGKGRLMELQKKVNCLASSLSDANNQVEKCQDQQQLLLRRLQDEAVSRDPQKTYQVQYSFYNDKMAELGKNLKMMRLEKHLAEGNARELRSQLWSCKRELEEVRRSEDKLKLRLDTEKDTETYKETKKQGKTEVLQFPCKELSR